MAFRSEELIDFAGSTFLDLKMFEKKVNEEEAAFGRRHSTSSNSNSKFSFYDLMTNNRKELSH